MTSLSFLQRLLACAFWLAGAEALVLQVMVTGEEEARVRQGMTLTKLNGECCAQCLKLVDPPDKCDTYVYARTHARSNTRGAGTQRIASRHRPVGTDYKAHRTGSDTICAAISRAGLARTCPAPHACLMTTRLNRGDEAASFLSCQYCRSKNTVVRNGGGGASQRVSGHHSTFERL